MTFQGRKTLGKRPPPVTPRDKPAPKRHALPPIEPEADGQPKALSGDVLEPQSPGLGADIPPHVWALLQQAGELAAQRLVQIIQSPRFGNYAPSAQRGLIELALTRAYGLPIRKALNLNLSSSDADAVAASLADLAGSLPETARQAVREALDPSPGMDTSQNG